MLMPFNVRILLLGIHPQVAIRGVDMGFYTRMSKETAITTLPNGINANALC